MNRFANELRQQITRELEGRGVELAGESAFDGVAFFDELKLYRAIHNLARNAAQAMPNGGHFTIRISADNEQLHIACADDGPGIPEAIRGRLFTAFVTAGKRDGTGLGLAMVKKIVDEHRGRITCDSERGRGTTFTLSLPLGGNGTT
jgi:signal transduction histidine kinase